MMRAAASLAVAGGLALAPLAAVITPLASTPAAASPAASSSNDAEVTVVHGVRGLVADISVDGKQVISSFSPARSAGPFALSPGKHKLVVTQDGGSDKTILSRTVSVTAGERATLALGLNSSGGPALYTYNDSLSSDSANPATLVMRDVASSSDAVAKVDGKSVGTIAAGHQLSHAIAAGKHTVSLVSTSGSSVLPSQAVPVQAGAVTALYLIGASSKSDLGWVATTLRPSSATLAEVSTGNSGLAADPGTPFVLIALTGAGSAALVVTGLVVVRRRRRDAAVLGAH